VDDGFQQFVDAGAGLGRGQDGVGGVQADDVLDLLADPLGLGGAGEACAKGVARVARAGRLVGDPAKLIAATGWSPRYSLDETLDAVIAHARTHVAT